MYLEEEAALTSTVRQPTANSFRNMWLPWLSNCSFVNKCDLSGGRDTYYWGTIKMSFKVWVHFISYSIQRLAGSFQISLFPSKCCCLVTELPVQVWFVRIFHLHCWSILEISNREEQLFYLVLEGFWGDDLFVGLFFFFLAETVVPFIH